MFDTRCHLDLPAGDPDGWGRVLELARSTPGLHAALGIHPQRLPALAPRGDDHRLADLERLLQAGGVVAVVQRPTGIVPATPAIADERELKRRRKRTPG